MNFPLKKRRGRPPKYLNIWENQRIQNSLLATSPQSGMDKKEVPGSDPEFTTRKESSDDLITGNVKCNPATNASESGDSNDDNNNNEKATDFTIMTTSVDTRMNTSQCDPEYCNSSLSPPQYTELATSKLGSRSSPNVIPVDDQVKSLAVQTSTGNDDVIKLSVVRHLKSNGLSASTNAPYIETYPSEPTGVCHSPQTVNCIYTTSSYMNSSSAPLVSQHDGLTLAENKGSSLIDNHSLSLANNAHVPEMVPLKRRPGRPPGSTKKLRTSFPPFIKPKSQEDQFSLRRFFEAGGRDYNEYLDWLKRKGTTGNPNVSPAVFPPFYPTNIPGNRMLISPSAPNGFTFQGSFPVTMTTKVSASNSAAFYGHPSAPTIASQMLIPGQNHVRRQEIAAPVTLTTQTQCQYSPNKYSITNDYNAEVSALDLSARGTRSDSDSEKENDVIEHDAAKRQRFGNDVISSRMHGTHQVVGAVRHNAHGQTTSLSEPDCWTVEQVADFVASLPECHVYSQAFRNHRIDGATLPHLSDDHLLNHVGMKLGHMIRLQIELGKLKRDK